MEKDMTKREFYEAVIETTEDDVLKEFAQGEIDKMDLANEKRKAKVSKKQLENAPLVNQIVNEILTDEPKTATDIAEVMGLSVQKASYLARAAVAEGRAVQSEVKVPKKGTQKGYTLA